MVSPGAVTPFSMYSYAQTQGVPHPVTAAAMAPPTSATHAAIAQLQAAHVANGQVAALQPPGLTHLTQRLSPYGGYQPIMYWYPSPPVSPQSAYFVQACPTTVVMKGLPFNAQPPDVLAFFDGIYEVRHLFSVSKYLPILAVDNSCMSK